MARDQLNRIREKGATEARRLFWIFAYLWILLGLFALHKSIILNEPHLLYHQGFEVINALVLAKIMFVAEALQLVDNLKHKPLIYPILYKSAVFSVILISFHLFEDVLLDMWHGKTVAESMADQGGEGLEGIFVLGVIMFVVLMPFFALREIGRDVGDGKLFEQFFVRRTPYIPLQR